MLEESICYFRGCSGGAKVLSKLSESDSEGFYLLFLYRGVLLIWILVGQGPIALVVGVGEGLFGHFLSRLSFLFSFSLSGRRPDTD